MEETLDGLVRENERLRRDNENLMEIIIQMRVTLNRLMDRYMMDSDQPSAE